MSQYATHLEMFRSIADGTWGPTGFSSVSAIQQLGEKSTLFDRYLMCRLVEGVELVAKRLDPAWKAAAQEKHDTEDTRRKRIAAFDEYRDFWDSSVRTASAELPSACRESARYKLNRICRELFHGMAGYDFRSPPEKPACTIAEFRKAVTAAIESWKWPDVMSKPGTKSQKAYAAWLEAKLGGNA